MSKVIARCRSCGAPIIWARHRESGKAAPINAAPVPNGNITLDPLSDHYRILSGEERKASTDPLYTNHFGTCPNAKSHKKPSKS